MKRKNMAFLGILGLVASMLTGCTSTGAGDSTTDNTAAAETTTSAPAETTTSAVTTTQGTTTSADTTSSTTGGKRIAVVCKAMDSEFWMSVKKGAEDAGKETGATVFVTAPDKESNVEGQFKIIEDLIQQKYDAICIAPCDSTGVVPIIEDAQAKGIKVLTIDTDADTDKKLSFVGTDNKAGGKMAGEELIKLLSGKEGAKVAMITGVPGQQTMRDRADGFKEAIEGKLDLVDEQPADSDPAKAMTVMENMLTTHPDLDGVFILNATMTVSSLEAVDNAGKTDLNIIGFDSSTDALQAVKDGKVKGVVAQSPENMGKFAVENAFKAVNGEEISNRIDTGTEMITSENVDKYLK